jgi:hypothetical protein
VLKPYTLEPPPPLPPLDDGWEDGARELAGGRRAYHDEDEVGFWELPSLRHLAVLGSLALTDRRLVALEEPLFIWEVTSEGDLMLSCEVDFDAEVIRYARTDDGTRLWLGSEDGKEELLVSCYGGTVEARQEKGGIRLRASGRDRVRLAVVAAWSEVDRDHTLRALARKGVSGVAAQFVRHLGMIEALGARITTPVPGSVERVEELKVSFDAVLHEERDGHRTLLEPLEDGCALLALGLREPVRDTLRGPFTDPELLRLLAAYAKWAGPDDFLLRHWPRATAALRDAVAVHSPLDELDHHRDAADELTAVAEALGDHTIGPLLEQLVEGVDGLPRPRQAWKFPEKVIEPWGIVPGALEGMVTLAPALPEGWPEMTFERLRIGTTSMDVRVKRRPTGVAVKVRVTRGPPIVVVLAPRLDFVPTGVLLQGEQLAGPTVQFTAEGEVEAVWVA